MGHVVIQLPGHQLFSFLSLCYDCLLFVTLKEKKKELVPLAISSGMLGFFKIDSI